MPEPQQPPMPKKVCMMTIMFPIIENETAYTIKTTLDEVIKDIPDKRFTFQIIES